jgi:uncharacterized protein
LADLPSSQKAINMLRNSGCPSNVINHCKAVSRTAVGIAKKLTKNGVNIDLELVRIGGLLHDIGRSKTHSINHALIGSEIAQSYNLPRSVINIIERHIGSGITAEEASKLGLPKRDFIPITLEEKIVSYADKLIDKDQKVDFKEAYEKFASELGLDHPAVPRLKELHKEITTLLGDLPNDTANIT